MSSALRLLVAAAICAVASAQLGASWPTGPVARPSERADRAPVERAASVRLDASSSRRRLVAEEDSERDIALIMLWSAIGLIFIGYFTFSALFRMEVENDALLYSKVRGAPLSPAERPARAPLPPRPAAPPGAALGPAPAPVAPSRPLAAAASLSRLATHAHRRAARRTPARRQRSTNAQRSRHTV